MRLPGFSLTLALFGLGSCATERDTAAPGHDWLAASRARRIDAAHRFVVSGPDFVAEVPALRLTARFDDAGAHIGSGDGIGVRTTGLGRRTSLTTTFTRPELGACQDGMADPEGRCIPRLEYVGEAWIEWWASTPEGFEQGWEIDLRPEGDGPLVVDVAIEGADATVSESGAWLQGDDGSLLIASGLDAWDAHGEPLDARFERTVDGFRLIVDDLDAVYPIVIDPVYGTASWSIEGPYGTAPFAETVVGVGDVDGDGYDDVMVGSSGCSYVGAAWLYGGSATGVSTVASATLTSPAVGYVSSNSSLFGATIAGAGDIDGDGYDDVVIGAYRADEAYVYLGSAAGLASLPATTIASATTGYSFGYTVGGAGDVNGDGYDDVLIGEGGTLNTTTGSVYVYYGSSLGIATAPDVTLTGETGGESFGNALAGAGDVNADGYDDIVVGDSGYSDNAGRIYVFEGSASGVSTSPTTTLDGTSRGGRFGGSVDGAGDVDGDGYGDVVIGARDANAFRGGAYLVGGSESGLTAVATWSVGGESPSEYLGYSVAGLGDVNGDGYADVAVGAPYAGAATQGLAHVYTGSASGLATTPVVSLDCSATSSSARVGWSVAGAGDTNGDGYDDVIVGTQGAAADGDPGAAWVYLGSASATMTGSTTLWGTSDGYLGAAIASAGDVDGDGYDDVVVSAYGFFAETGQVYLYPGSATGLSTTAALTLTGSGPNVDFGRYVAGAGDVDGDGYDDVIIGAINTGERDSMAYVHRGSASGLSTTPSTTLVGVGTDPTLVFSLYGAVAVADLDVDGYDDVALVGVGGAPDYLGYVLIYYGSPTGTSSTVGDMVTQARTCGYTRALALPGDVNGDGWPDIAVGCGSADEVLVYLGPDWRTSTTLTGETTSDDDNFGGSVAGAGDVNADGYDDLVVGEYNYTTNPGIWPDSDHTGSAYVFHGSASGLSPTPATSLYGRAAGGYFGYTVAEARDMDGDGYDDVVVGAYGDGGTGAVFVYPGSASGVVTTPSITLTGTDSLGTAVASAGDVDGDGAWDLLVAASAYDYDAGLVVAYRGYVDADGDGAAASDECDDHDATDTSGPATLNADADADGYGDPSVTTEACPGTAGYVADATDCDDAASSRWPGAPETCGDHVDQDCDGIDVACQDTGDSDDDTDGADSRVDTAAAARGDGDPTTDAEEASRCGCSTSAPVRSSLLLGVLVFVTVRRRSVSTRSAPTRGTPASP